MNTNHLRTLARYSAGIDLRGRLEQCERVVAQQAAALNAAADDIDSLREMVVTLTRELEHCKASNAEA